MIETSNAARLGATDRDRNQGADESDLLLGFEGGIPQVTFMTWAMYRGLLDQAEAEETLPARVVRQAVRDYLRDRAAEAEPDEHDERDEPDDAYAGAWTRRGGVWRP